MILDSLISSPIDFPKIIPNNWNKWWDIWFKEASFVKKIVHNHNIGQALWKGFDIYVKEGVNADEYGYLSKYVECAELFPNLFDNLEKFPVDISVIRAVSSFAKISPHSDLLIPNRAIRTMMYDNNVKPTFYYLSKDKKYYQTLPEDTNTWFYNDHYVKHASDYYQGHSKILLMYWGKIKENILEENVLNSKNKFNDYIIMNV